MRRKSRKTDPENGSSNDPEENPENGSENAETEEDGESDVKKPKSSKKGEKSPKKTPKSEKRALKEATEDEDQKNGAESGVDAESESGERDAKRRKTSKTPKKTPKSNKKGAEQDENEDADEEQYEVEAIVDSKMVRGVKHYLIRWKGYDASSDTWESKDSLNCSELIKQYNNNPKNATPKNKGRKKKNETADEEEGGDDGDDDDGEYEVDKIVEVHHKRNGKKEFLVSWKGYPQSQDSWVDEEDMDCKDLIAKFMAKVEKAKNVAPKQLRENRSQTDRFTLNTRESGRRLSRRNKGKQRVQYHNTE